VKRVVLSTGSLMLIAVVVIAVHVLALGAVADAESGRSPVTAMILREGQNTGALGPGQAQWYKLVQAGDDGALQQQMDLTLIFTPDDGLRSQRVTLQIFGAEQMADGYRPDTSRMQALGTGEVVSRDGNPDTGELLWSGWAVHDSTYYVRVLNGSEVGIHYWLFTDDVISAGLGEGDALAPAAEVPAGANPDQPSARKPTFQTGQLAAGQQTWYPVVYNDDDSQVYEAHTFTLVFTPDDGRRVQQVGFELMSLEERQALQAGDSGQLPGIGVSQAVSRDPDPLTGERVWSGWLVDGQTYYAHLHNDSEVAIDYWWFSD
jgi:hypothetical protein